MNEELKWLWIQFGMEKDIFYPNVLQDIMLKWTQQKVMGEMEKD